MKSYRVVKQQDVPQTEHFAIITFERISLHDYYDCNNPDVRTVAVYTVYPERAEWEADIKKMKLNQEQFVPLQSKTAQIETEIKIKINP